jgi:hypothetical protein
MAGRFAMQNAMTGRLPTMPPRSAVFYIAIILTPLAVGLLIVAPQRPASWIVILAGGLAFFDCLRRLQVKYQLVDAGITRERLGGGNEITWELFAVLCVSSAVYAHMAQGDES